MDALNKLLQNFVTESEEILSGNLVGIYLHGSAAMGCYNAQKSDVDLLVVTDRTPSDEVKIRFMDEVVKLNGRAPPKGIEMSVVKSEVCNPFVYPTPFELHFSVAHLNRYKADPLGYIDKMKGADKDLAAHITVIRHRGKCIFGKDIKDVFGKVRKEDFFDSIYSDIENAEREITDNPTYIILNLCRALAYKREGLILSKQEGGEWGIRGLPGRYRPVIKNALRDYTSGGKASWDKNISGEFAAYMLSRINR